MKVIIPLAGKGTRLRPHTHLTPKPMLKVAGKPVMSYVLDELKRLGNVEQIIYITGHLKEKSKSTRERRPTFRRCSSSRRCRTEQPARSPSRVNTPINR